MAVVGRVLLIPKGNYVNTDVYNRLDWVRYNGAAWVCKQDNTTGVAPSLSASEWQVLAQDGTVGGWTSITGKPFDTIGTGLLVNSSNELTIAKNMITDKVTIQALNELLTGTGTAGYDAGSGASPRYFPAKFIYNTPLTTLADGDMVTIKMPVAGSEYGTYLSIDGGSNYHPIALHDAVKFATEYSVGSYVTLIYNSNGAVDDIYPVTGGDSPSTVTGGAFRVLNYLVDSIDVDQTYDGTSANPQSGTAIESVLATTITVSNVSVSAGSNARIPASGTDARIKTTSTVIPLCDDASPYKYSAITVSAGYVEIKMAETVSGIEVGILVINH